MGFKNAVLTLLVTGSMVECANPIDHIGTNMPSQKSKIFLEKNAFKNEFV